ncbi:MAG: NADH-quinone oxidoreductase subunit M [Bacteroidetes bacterium]|nr:NADH-quinone oxidoreductase subunit M [Bacteroidota bacterium]
MPSVSLLIFLPIAGAVVVSLMRSANAVRWTALAFTLATFALSVPLYLGFDPTNTALQFKEEIALLRGIDVKWLVGIDGINVLLVMLTTLLGPIIVLGSWTYIQKQHRGFYALYLLLQGAVMGVFTSFDVMLFYVFFELTLIPMYFIIGIWGAENRIYAATKFVIYTLVGSLLMLVGLLWIGYAAGDAVNGGVFTTDYFKLLQYNVPLGVQTWLFIFFALAFAIKVPLFPFHTWLPDAHVQAPTGGSVVLAGTLLKMGTYGLIRFCLPLFPVAAQKWAIPMVILGVIGIVYGALVSRVQTDAKKLVAYSSVSHLGFVVLGIFAFNETALQGAIIQNINHGISTGALFLLVGFLYERRHSRMMKDYGGVAKVAPILTFFMVLSVMASAGLPGLNGFVGEFLILIGSFSAYPVLVAVATTGVILAAIYLLWLLYNVFFGPVTDHHVAEMKDLNRRETLALLPLAVLMVVMGFFPNTFLNKSELAAQQLLETVEAKRLATLDAAQMAAPMHEAGEAPGKPAGREEHEEAR